jgi:hypothetical protein
VVKIARTTASMVRRFPRFLTRPAADHLPGRPPTGGHGRLVRRYVHRPGHARHPHDVGRLGRRHHHRCAGRGLPCRQHASVLKRGHLQHRRHRHGRRRRVRHPALRLRRRVRPRRRLRDRRRLDQLAGRRLPG